MVRVTRSRLRGGGFLANGFLFVNTGYSEVQYRYFGHGGRAGRKVLSAPFEGKKRALRTSHAGRNYLRVKPGFCPGPARYRGPHKYPV